ncbi:hypothetical protein [Halovenus salina]|uniref:PGF-CTERM protein n=1 Tax=Halovenus salina TaxID=1510225 RepID=A0ABD5VYI6_9EURY
MTVTFAETVIDTEPGTYTLRIETPDDAMTRELVVEASEENESQETDDSSDAPNETDEQPDGGDEDDSENEDGSGPAVFAVGSRRTALVGGTAVVAGIHVLGYWV